MLSRISRQSYRTKFVHLRICINHKSSFPETTDEVTPVDRLLRMKPMLKQDKSREDDFEGLPNPNDYKEIIGDDDDVEESDPRHKLGKHLLYMGKVHYRHIESIPHWVREKQSEICHNRTSAQIRRCVKSWMLESHRDLQKKYTERELGWNNLQLKSISHPKEIFEYGPEETIAYSHYFFPSRFAINKRILNELKTIIPEFHPFEIFDFGCGPGTSGAAAISVWKDKIINGYTGVDVSQSMLDAAKLMIDKNVKVDIHSLYDQSNSTNNNSNRSKENKYIMKSNQIDKKDNYYDELNNNNNEEDEDDYTPLSIPQKCSFFNKTLDIVHHVVENNNIRYSLSILSYILADLPSDATRIAATQLCYEMLEENGIMVIVDVGNPYGSHAVRSARQFILDTFNTNDIVEDKFGSILNGQRMILPTSNNYEHKDFGAFVLSPCTHDLNCPLGTSNWCSFSQKVKYVLFVYKYTDLFIVS